MKKFALACILALLCLAMLGAHALAEELVVHLTFDAEDEDYMLNGGAVVEDGVLKLPGGDMRSAYAELPFAALMDTEDQATICMWIYVPADSDVNTYFVSFSNGNSWPAFTGRILPSGVIALNFDNRGILITEPIFPQDAWTHLTLSISKYAMKIYLNGQRAAMYDGAADVQERCGWYRVNGADRGTTHYHELDKISMPSGYLGTPTYNFYYELEGDSMAMFDDYRIYDRALDDEKAAALYESLAVPAAAWPIGSPADPTQQAAEIDLPETPEDGLRVFYSFDDEDEMYTLYNGAKVQNGVLTLPGGAFRKAGHLELPKHAIANCVEAMTVSTWININNYAIGDQFIFAISADEGWPAMYLMTWGDGTMHYNIDYRSMLNTDQPLPSGRWVYLAAVISRDEVTLYVDGKLFAGYDRASRHTTGGTWEMLNVQNDLTQFCEIDRVGNRTIRLGSAFMDVGYRRVDAIAQYDNFRIYSRALNAEDVAALYAQECQETGYAK